MKKEKVEYDYRGFRIRLSPSMDLTQWRFEAIAGPFAGVYIDDKDVAVLNAKLTIDKFHKGIK